MGQAQPLRHAAEKRLLAGDLFRLRLSEEALRLVPDCGEPACDHMQAVCAPDGWERLKCIHPVGHLGGHGFNYIRLRDEPGSPEQPR